jgi:hypothetical protein
MSVRGEDFGFHWEGMGMMLGGMNSRLTGGGFAVSLMLTGCRAIPSAFILDKCNELLLRQQLAREEAPEKNL